MVVWFTTYCRWCAVKNWRQRKRGLAMSDLTRFGAMLARLAFTYRSITYRESGRNNKHRMYDRLRVISLFFHVFWVMSLRRSSCECTSYVPMVMMPRSGYNASILGVQNYYIGFEARKTSRLLCSLVFGWELAHEFRLTWLISLPLSGAIFFIDTVRKDFFATNYCAGHAVH